MKFGWSLQKLNGHYKFECLMVCNKIHYYNLINAIVKISSIVKCGPGRYQVDMTQPGQLTALLKCTDYSIRMTVLLEYVGLQNCMVEMAE